MPPQVIGVRIVITYVNARGRRSQRTIQVDGSMASIRATAYYVLQETRVVDIPIAPSVEPIVLPVEAVDGGPTPPPDEDATGPLTCAVCAELIPPGMAVYLRGDPERKSPMHGRCSPRDG